MCAVYVLSKQYCRCVRVCVCVLALVLFSPPLGGELQSHDCVQLINHPCTHDPLGCALCSRPATAVWPPFDPVSINLSTQSERDESNPPTFPKLISIQCISSLMCD